MVNKIFSSMTSLASSALTVSAPQLPVSISKTLTKNEVFGQLIKDIWSKFRELVLFKDKRTQPIKLLISKPLQVPHPRGLILSTRGCKTSTSQKSGSKPISSDQPIRVCLLGANSKLAAPLALMLKESPLVDELVLHDTKEDPLGMAIDLSHIDTPVRLYSHSGSQEIQCALQGSSVVVLTGGFPGSPKNEKNELFNENVNWVTEQIEAICHYAPCAHIAIITQPVNSIVPHATEVMKRMKCYAPRRLYGVTAIDSIRASTFYSEIIGESPENVYVPVIGGTNNGLTITPLFSLATPSAKLTKRQITDLTAAVQCSPIDVFEARTETHGPATLATAFGAARFIISMIKGIVGQPNIFETAYTKSDHIPTCTYFAGPLKLGVDGIEHPLEIPKKLSSFEEGLLKVTILEIQTDIRLGESLMRTKTRREEVRRKETPSQSNDPCTPVCNS